MSWSNLSYMGSDLPPWKLANAGHSHSNGRVDVATRHSTTDHHTQGDPHSPPEQAHGLIGHNGVSVNHLPAVGGQRVSVVLK